jgi:hypothetical protein
MRNLERRLRKLETGGRDASGRASLRVVIMPAGSRFGEDFERTCKALDSCEFAQSRRLIILGNGPTGLRDYEWKQFQQAYESGERK